MPDAAVLLALLRAAIPKGITIAADDPCAGSYGLWPGESLDHAVPKRMAEFAAGRRAARAAMALQGIPPDAVPFGQDRAPIWPSGVTGSITHTHALCLAVVGQSRDWAGLGFDLEDDRDLEPDLWPEVLRAEELVVISGLPLAGQARAAMDAFVAKEAVYKAIYPTSRTLMDFHALHITATDKGFVAQLMIDLPAFAKGTRLSGLTCRADGYVAAFCGLDAFWL